jgi:GNAT superfamily N-acetyltransferase
MNDVIFRTSIRAVLPDDAAALTGLAMRSKAYWGYPPEFMARCRAELTVSPADVLDERLDYRLAEQDAMIVGFYALETLPGDEVELEALFVEPAHIGTGVGRLLMQHALRNAARRRARRLRIQGDPNAADFYEAAGATRIGELESHSIPGRLLPLYEIRLPGEMR